jgi:hypothetical protein
MLDRIRNHWFRLAGMLMGAVLTLSTLVLPLQPAKAQCLGVDLGLVCAGLGVPSAFSHHAYYYDYPYPGYPPATAAPAPVPQYGSTAPAVEVPSNAGTTSVLAPFAPPARLNETPPSAPSQLIWQPEHWSWTGTEYAWTPGHYVMGPSPTAIRVPD